MLEQLVDLVAADPALQHRGRYVDGTVRIDVGEDSHFLEIAAGKVVAVERGPRVMPTTRLVLRASREEWEEFWRPRPKPGHHDVMALLRRRVLRIEGDMHLFMANLRYFKEILEKPRVAARPAGGHA